MPWNITYHTQKPEVARIGDMWPEPDWANSNVISQRYRNTYSKTRPPLCVIIPSVYCEEGDFFLIDRIASGGGASDKGWQVTIVGELVDGQQPDITLKPSIDAVGSYHGHIRHGVITDDIEGRQYDTQEQRDAAREKSKAQVEARRKRKRFK